MYLHFGYPLQLTNSPYCPFRSSSGLPHFGHASSSCTGDFCCTFWFSLRIVLHGGSSLSPGHAMNGPHGPFRSTITRPQLSQNSSSGTSSAPGALRSGLAAKLSLVKSQLTGLTLPFLPLPCPSLTAAANSFASATSFEKSVTSSVTAFTSIGKLNAVVTFFVTAFASFFHGPAATVIGFALEK